MRRTPNKQGCTVCGRSRGMTLKAYRGFATLCAFHDDVVRGMIPAPTTMNELRALFPARATEHRRLRESSAA